MGWCTTVSGAWAKYLYYDPYPRVLNNVQFDGRGVLQFPNGTKYEGEWVQGLREGTGTLTLATGETYEGAWRADKVAIEITSCNVVVSVFFFFSDMAPVNFAPMGLFMKENGLQE